METNLNKRFRVYTPQQFLEAGNTAGRTNFSSAGVLAPESSSNADLDWSQADRFRYSGVTEYDRRKRITRARWLMDVSADAAGIVEAIATNVGVPVFRAQTSSQAYNDAADVFVLKYFKNLDVTGLNFREIVSTIVKEFCVAGDCFVVLRAETMQVQLIRSEFCGSIATPKNPLERNGVIRDEFGTITHYRFCKPNTSGYADFTEKNTITVPAELVLPVFDGSCMYGNRANPLLSPALPVLFSKLQIRAAKTGKIMQSTFLSLVETMPDEADDDLGANPEKPSTPIVDPDLPEDHEDNLPAEADRGFDIVAPGQTRILYGRGRKIEMFEPKHEITDFIQFDDSKHVEACSAVQLPPELGKVGFGGTNYSSSRVILEKWDTRREQFHAILRERLLMDLYSWMRSIGEGLKLIPKCPKGEEDMFEFIWDRTPSVDSMNDAKESELRINSGQSTYQIELAKRSLFWEEVFEQRAKEEALLEKLAVKYGVSVDILRKRTTPNGATPNVLPGDTVPA